MTSNMELEGFVVVCTTLHGALGLFKTQAKADEIADRHTAQEKGKTDCVYRSVPCTMRFGDFFN